MDFVSDTVVPFLTGQADYVGHRYLLILMYGIPCLLLERLPRIGIRRGKPWLSPSVLYDTVQSFFDLLFLLNIQFFIIDGMVWLRDTHLSFFKIGWFDGASNTVQALVFWVAWDFQQYWSHRWRHEIPWLWAFHTIHHSQREMNPITTYRAHIGEDIIMFCVRVLPLALIGGSAGALTWLTIYTTFLSYWLHTAVRINMGPLRYILVGPQHHIVHHSIERKHWNKNYSEGLFIWDLLFGTAHTDFNEYPETGVQVCDVHESSRHPLHLIRTYRANFFYPFRQIRKQLADRRSRAPAPTLPAPGP